MSRSKFLITPASLKNLIANQKVQVIDGTIRSSSEEHDLNKIQCIPNTLYFDINFYCSKNSSLPHMMMSYDEFEKSMADLGLTTEKTIVVYDRSAIFSSPRVWWNLRDAGFPDVKVLDGGLPAWIASGGKLDFLSKTPTPNINSKLQLKGKERQNIANLKSVKYASESDDYVILDARSKERFMGLATEPRLGLKSGHIPNSINLPYTELLKFDGTFKSDQHLVEIFNKLNILSKHIIVSCGSGVTAAILGIALSIIGKDDYMLYDGSWCEWGSQNDLQIETSKT